MAPLCQTGCAAESVGYLRALRHSPLPVSALMASSTPRSGLLGVLTDRAFWLGLLTLLLAASILVLLQVFWKL